MSEELKGDLIFSIYSCHEHLEVYVQILKKIKILGCSGAHWTHELKLFKNFTDTTEAKMKPVHTP